MDRERLKKNLVELYQYFKLSNLPDSKQIDLWHEDLKYIPDSALDGIFAILKSNDNVPRNLPKAFKHAYGTSGKVVVINYDKDNDPRYPIENLWKGLSILEQQGDSAFNYYCESVKMPFQDRDRVRNKLNCIHNLEELKPNDMFESFGETKDREDRIRFLRNQKSEI